MSDRDDFITWIGSRLKDAEIALHNGDAAPRSAIWSHREPVTVLGAWMSGNGPEEVGNIFRQLEGSFSDCTSYSHEVIAADVIGEMAYTVGYEHTSAIGERRTEDIHPPRNPGVPPRRGGMEGGSPPRRHSGAAGSVVGSRPATRAEPVLMISPTPSVSPRCRRDARRPHHRGTPSQRSRDVTGRGRDPARWCGRCHQGYRRRQAPNRR